jgi:predicted adenylyl cyclase CyaB
LFENGSGQLISYVRKNQTGPKISEYNIYETADPHSLLAVLEKSHGIRGVVEKSRELYHCGKTRIHLDQVYDLGDFLELEVVLGEHEDRRAGEKEAAELMKKLQISEDNLVADAYIDLLEKTS